RSYYGYNADNKVERIHLGFTALGFHSTVYSPAGDEFIDPVVYGNQAEYFVYNRKNLRQDPNNKPICSTVGDAQISPFDDEGSGGIGTEAVGGTLKTYRLALNSSKEYTAVFGTIALAESAMVVAVNRVTGVYEIDFGIRLNLTYKKAYTAADAFSFSNSSGGTMLGQNQSQCDTLVGNANYDVGHVFSTGGGGVAGLGVTGTMGQKARGVTGLPSPTGDAFYIDYVAHEMGHQFGGNHTFNGIVGNCGGGNRSGGAAYEPGSGSTIMPYAGICGSDDLQAHSDAYFHAKSIEEIVTRRQLGTSGGTAVANGNIAPVVNAGAAFTIPLSTPFKLTGSATDANGDAMTYCWEQYNLGSTVAATNTASGVLFRSYNPTTVPYRTFPKLTTVLANSSDIWEVLPTVARTMNFRMTVRDNRAGGGENNFGAKTITVSGAAFSVTSPNTAVSWPAGSTQTVTWNKGGTTSANVNILLSTASGTNFDTGAGVITVLANTPNDGSETITVPAVAATTCRIKIEPTDNIYFDVSNVNFTITASQTVTGNVTLQNIVPSPNGQVVALQIFAVGGSSALRTANVTLDASGNYSYTVSPALANGNYDVRLKGSHWLAKRVANRAFGATGASAVSASLINGDSQPDNVIDLSDYTIVVSAFNGSLATADLNLDGIVDLTDYTVLVTNFNAIGDN
ncbi:MAG: hypothetical protein K8R88_05210, partial [Armatimonadetes bacterium]|nr:hypothetical protein [Armatimonadota bacterium]